MLDESDLNSIIEDLRGLEVSTRATCLRLLQQDPSKDQKVLPYLEKLLEDTTPCIVMLPYRFGEIRWLAANALAAERAALGIKEPVRLQDVVRPLSTEEFVAIRNKVGIEAKGGIEGVLSGMSVLLESGNLPLCDMVLK